MKKQLLRHSIILALYCLGLFWKTLEANAQAYDMIYRDTITGTTNLTSMNHQFSLKLYQNCNVTQQNFGSLPVMYRVNGMAWVSEMMIGQALGFGNPFCNSQSPTCSPNGPLNYQVTGSDYTFAAKMNLSVPGSHVIQTRINLGGNGLGSFQAANIAGNFSLEPELDNNFFVNGMRYTPPAFVNPPVIFANVNQLVSFSSAAIDADGDSLVYRLRPVSNSATYATGFTYLNPITANPALNLNARTGLITFKPTVYDQAAGPGATANKYVIGMDVDEYRKINGAVTKIGTIQRNILVNVISQTNNSPVLSVSQNSTTLAPNSIIDVYVGSQVAIQVTATDPDVSNTVSLSANSLNYLPGSTFAPVQGQGTLLTWTPTAAFVRNEPYFFNVTATDDACPYPASVTHTYGFRVRNITGISPDRFKPASFTAFPNPFSDEVNFRFNLQTKAQSITIFNLLGQQIDEIQLKTIGSGEQKVQWQNANNHAAGTYVARLITEDKTIQTLKFTKLQ